ncbi:MAG: SgcJ/EcaC family oxidoreductase [Saccharothrix sp.]|nr:SgcJ/EcaC family oxidoreductase [Saccharothrix sp.]
MIPCAQPAGRVNRRSSIAVPLFGGREYRPRRIVWQTGNARVYLELETIHDETVTWNGVATLDKAGVVEAIEVFTSAWNDHDMVRHFSVFAEDADFVDVVGRRLRGRSAALADQRARHAQRFAESTVRTLELDVRLVRPDVAVAHYHWEMTGDRGSGDTGPGVRRGIFTFVLSHQDGRWLVVAAHNTESVA